MDLLLAWLVIRLAADLVPNAVLARLIAVLAWGVAALCILRATSWGPRARSRVLDSVAIFVGGLRVSLLIGCERRVSSLTVLLWAATLRVSALRTADHPSFRKSHPAPECCWGNC